MRRRQQRRIGPIGTSGRVLLGLFALYLALFDGPPFADGLGWSLDAYDAALGLVVLPAIPLAVAVVARRRGSGPLRLTGPVAASLNCVVIVALILNPYTAGGALLFYGATLLIAAWRGQLGCEATVIPNWLLGRDDQLGCPTFSPLDAAEAHLRLTSPVKGGAPPGRGP